MRCPKCHKTYDDKLSACSFCAFQNSLDDTLSNEVPVEDIESIEKLENTLSDTIELKTTKKKIRNNNRVSLDKTIAININNMGTLLDDINNQIEEVNKSVEAEENEDKIVDKKYTYVESSNNSKQSKKNVVWLTIIASVLLFGFIVSLLLFANDMSHKSRVSLTFEDKLNNAIDEYFINKELDNLIFLMEDVKTDSDKVSKIQNATREECEKLVLKYELEEAKSQKKYDDITYEYREMLDGLYRYALVKNDDTYIRALSEDDYDNILLKFEGIYNSGLDFYGALDLYSEKDYNRSYYMFSKIEEDNPYYEKSLYYIDKIYENIIHLLNVDILKLEQDIDTLSDKEKLDLYVVIEETILEYNNVYVLDLNDNVDYQNILQVYTNKVSEYTDIVYKE